MCSSPQLNQAMKIFTLSQSLWRLTCTELSTPDRNSLMSTCSILCINSWVAVTTCTQPTSSIETWSPAMCFLTKAVNSKFVILVLLEVTKRNRSRKDSPNTLSLVGTVPLKSSSMLPITPKLLMFGRLDVSSLNCLVAPLFSQETIT